MAPLIGQAASVPRPPRVASETDREMLEVLRQISAQLRALEPLRVANDAQRLDLHKLRELVAHRGPQPGPGDAWQPTLPGGIETPYAMADISIVQAADLVGRGVDFQAVGQSSDIHHYTGGQILIAVNEVKPPALFSYAADVQVVAMVSNQVNILATAVVNSGTGPLLVQIPPLQAYTYLTVKARQLVNGFPSAAFPANDATMLGAELVLSASGRFYR
jgi:hypothetical protein